MKKVNLIGKLMRSLRGEPTSFALSVLDLLWGRCMREHRPNLHSGLPIAKLNKFDVMKHKGIILLGWLDRTSHHGIEGCACPDSILA